MLRTARSFSPVPFVALTLALTASACAPSDPQARVAKIRSEYTVTLNSWRVLEPEIEAATDLGEVVGEEIATEDTAGEEAAEEGAGAEGAELTEEAAAEEAPSSKTVLFDLLVQFDADDPLPGITLVISLVDPFEQEKDHRRHWIDTANYYDGILDQFSFELGGFDVVEGDRFSVDVRSHVPEEERGEYREFVEAGR